MTFNKFLILVTAFTFLFLTACGGGTETPKNTTNTNVNSTAPVNTNTNTTITSPNSAVATSTATPAQTTNNADTLKPVVLKYYQALKNKDEAALRSVCSKDTLAYWDGEMKAEGEKSLVKYLTDSEPVPPQPFEVRNEQINGDVGVAELMGGVYKTWIKFKFVKENSEWKITNQSPDFQQK